MCDIIAERFTAGYPIRMHVRVNYRFLSIFSWLTTTAFLFETSKNEQKLEVSVKKVAYRLPPIAHFCNEISQDFFCNKK